MTGGFPVQFVGTSTNTYFLNGGTENTETGEVNLESAYVVAALAYICMRYRATKLVEAPLMVVEETEEGEEWLKDHELNPLLARANRDYGTRRLIESTEIFLATSGVCLWVKNRDRSGRVASIYPFNGNNVRIKSGRVDGELRVYGSFEVLQAGGNWKPIDPADVVHFREFHPGNPYDAVSPLDAAMSHLNMGQTLKFRVKKMLQNAAMPGGAYIADKDWQPDDDEFDNYSAKLDNAFRGVNTGRIALLVGGGKLERTAMTLQELAMGELWRECEAIVCGCFGVPASLVGTIVGLENSPWSHLETAKRSFYDETIIPRWAFLEEPITDQLLREIDEDPAHLIRFDKSRVRALQRDLVTASIVANSNASFWSVNERRIHTGMKPINDKAADAIPELAAPIMPPAPDPDEDIEDDEEQDEEKRALRQLQKKGTLRVAVFEATRQEQENVLTLVVTAQLDRDRNDIMAAVEPILAGRKADEPVDRDRGERARAAAERALEQVIRRNWRTMILPFLRRSAEKATRIASSDIPDLDFDLLLPDVLKYADREAAWLVKEIESTTRDKIVQALKDGIEAGEGSQAIARRVAESAAFSPDRAKLVARTESTRVMNGAPREALADNGRRTGRQYVKTWFAVTDSRTRDEHIEMNGEQRAIDKPFSNGLQAPGEPNCRCTILFSAVEAV